MAEICAIFPDEARLPPPDPILAPFKGTAIEAGRLPLALTASFPCKRPLARCWLADDLPFAVLPPDARADAPLTSVLVADVFAVLARPLPSGLRSGAVRVFGPDCTPFAALLPGAPGSVLALTRLLVLGFALLSVTDGMTPIAPPGRPRDDSRGQAAAPYLNLCLTKSRKTGIFHRLW